MGGVVIFLKKATTPLTKKHVYLFLESVVCTLKGWYLKKKLTHTLEHLN